MNERHKPQDIKSAVSSIAQYAEAHALSPEMVCDIFSAGLCAARILRPELESTMPTTTDVMPDTSVKELS